jgi:hypothetical protein
MLPGARTVTGALVSFRSYSKTISFQSIRTHVTLLPLMVMMTMMMPLESKWSMVLPLAVAHAPNRQIPESNTTTKHEKE